MVEMTLNTAPTRGLLYGLTALGCTVVFGNVSEICDVNEICPGRLAVIIAFGVIAALIAGVMFTGTLMTIDVIVKAEMLFAVALLILNSICVGLASSIRTRIGNSIAVSFSWFAEVISFILVFACLTKEGGILHQFLNRAQKIVPGDEELGEETPEDEYMHPIGIPTTDNDVSTINEELVSVKPSGHPPITMLDSTVAPVDGDVPSTPVATELSATTTTPQALPTSAS